MKITQEDCDRWDAVVKRLREENIPLIELIPCGVLVERDHLRMVTNYGETVVK